MSVFCRYSVFYEKKKKLSKSLRNRFLQPAVNQCVIATLSYSTLTLLLPLSYLPPIPVRVGLGGVGSWGLPEGSFVGYGGDLF